jgi:hypothetical protein
MLSKTKATFIAGAVAALVVAGSTPAHALTINDLTGTLTCGGSNFPTVEYKINVKTTVAWQKNNANGAGVRGGGDYLPNAPVYSQASTQGPDYFNVFYASGHLFSRFDDGCH